MKKPLLFWIIIIFLVGVVLLLPYPKKIQAVFYAEETFTGTQAKISFDMTYLRYLLKRDAMRGTIQVTCGDKTVIYTGDYLHYIGQWPLDNADETLHYFSGFYWNADIIERDENKEMRIGDFESVFAYLSKDFTRFALYHEPSEKADDTFPKQYVGNIEPNKIQETSAYFDRYIKDNMEAD